MLFAPQPPAVSYAREIAPILAMRCNRCHGEAGGLSSRTYSELMTGGNMGKVIIAGNGDGSLLVHFLDGRRGEARRMPLGGKALSHEQILTIRRWIDEGAREDSVELPKYVRSLPNVGLPSDRVLRVSCRVKVEAYLTLRVRDPRTGRVLLEWVETVTPEPDDADTVRPGQLLFRDVRPGIGWPKAVSVELQVQYAAGDPGELELTARIRDP